VAGYDPETGQFNGAASGGDSDPLLKAIKEVESLKASGVLSADEAAAKVAQIQQRLEAASAQSGRSTNLRNRMFGGASSAPIAQSSGTRPAAAAANDSASTSGYSMHSSGGGGGGGGAGLSGLGGGGGGGSGGGGDLIAGMLVRDGKLLKYSLSGSGVLTQATLQGAVEKQWPLGGDEHVACSTDAGKANHFTVVVAGGKSKLKLKANSEAEMERWVEAVRRAARMI
jgi:hypothetical protein